MRTALAADPRGPTSRATIITHVEEIMKQHIARALLVAIALVAACSGESSQPTGPTTSNTRDTTTTTGPQYARTSALR